MAVANTREISNRAAAVNRTTELIAGWLIAREQLVTRDGGRFKYHMGRSESIKRHPDSDRVNNSADTGREVLTRSRLRRTKDWFFVRPNAMFEIHFYNPSESRLITDAPRC